MYPNSPFQKRRLTTCQRGNGFIEKLLIIGLFTLSVAGGVRTLACSAGETLGEQGVTIATLRTGTGEGPQGTDISASVAAQLSRTDVDFSQSARFDAIYGRNTGVSTSNVLTGQATPTAATSELALASAPPTLVEEFTSASPSTTTRTFFAAQNDDAPVLPSAGDIAFVASRARVGSVPLTRNAQVANTEDGQPLALRSRMRPVNDEATITMEELIESYENADEDGDGIPNRDDPDSFLNSPESLLEPAAPGIPTWPPTSSLDPLPDDPNDPDGDNVIDVSDILGDTDGDGIENYWDPDSPAFLDYDFDGIPDYVDDDSPFHTDTDGDGIVDLYDEDFDYDAERLESYFEQSNERWEDDDGDGIPNLRDPDSSHSFDEDQDGIPNVIDNNTDAAPLPEPVDWSNPLGLPPSPPLDTLTVQPGGTPSDVDGDGIPNGIDLEPEVAEGDESDPSEPSAPNWGGDIGSTYTPGQAVELANDIREELTGAFTPEEWDHFEAAGIADLVENSIEELVAEEVDAALSGKTERRPPRPSGGDSDYDNRPGLEENGPSNNSGWGNRPGGEFG